MKHLQSGLPLIFTALLCSGCLAVAVGAAGGAAGGGVAAAKAGEHEHHSAGTYAAAVLSNVIYFPAKVIFAGAGAATGGLAYVFTLGNGFVSRSIWDASLGGDYLVTPSMIEGREKVHFVGPQAEPRGSEFY